MQITLFAVPVPGQCVRGENRFLGTVRTHMHKAPLTAVAAGLATDLNRDGLHVEVKICDLQTRNRDRFRYGELDLGGIILDKYRVGSNFEDVHTEICESDIIGISANYTHSRRIIADFVYHIRRIHPRVLVVVGGTDATCDSDYYLRAGADVVVRGEGELTFRQLIKSYGIGLEFTQIPNIHYKDRRRGAILANPATFLNRQTVLNIDHLPPPALDLINLIECTDTGEGRAPSGISGPFISVETSRGCAQACSFCATPVMKGRYRFMSSDTIGRHLEYFWSQGIRTLLFQEDNILSRVHRAKDGTCLFPDGRRALLDIFKLAQCMGFNWEFTNGLEFGQFEYNGIIDYELIQAMFHNSVKNDRMVGCYRATIPLENLTDSGPRLFRKLKPIGIMRDICRIIAQSDVKALTFNIIVGRPDDDEMALALSYERCLEIREVCLSSNPNIKIFFNVYALSLLPGTVDYKRYKNLLAFDLERDPEVITFYLGSLKTEHFTPLEITQARGTMAWLLNGDQLIEDYDETHFLTSLRFRQLFSGL